LRHQTHDWKDISKWPVNVRAFLQVVPKLNLHIGPQGAPATTMRVCGLKQINALDRTSDEPAQADDSGSAPLDEADMAVGEQGRIRPPVLLVTV
jgi:hypothetical protein